MKRRLFRIILILSIFLNFTLLYLGVLPSVMLYLNKPEINSKMLMTKKTEELIVESSIAMLNSKDGYMTMTEPECISRELRRIIKGKRHKFHNNYNKCFLLAGLTTYAKITKDSVLTSKIENIYTEFLNEEGRLSYEISSINQIPIGLSALDLYTITKNIKYKILCDSIFVFLEKRFSPNHGVLYKEGRNRQFNDVLMIVPFLQRYGSIFNCNIANQMALKQIQIYQEYGIDKETGIPSHGYDLETKVKLGSINWGRGIGWYAYAMSFVSQATDPLFLRTCNLIYKRNKYFAQFIGDESSKFDSSSSLIIGYSLAKISNSLFDITPLLDSLTSKGLIYYSSGDTYELNHYSRTYGYSELTQGFLLMALTHNTKIKNKL